MNRIEPLICDLLILGSGIAGLRGALEVADSGWKVVVATKDQPQESNTEYAQGGIAVALAEGDDPEIHFQDTLKAGDGLCDGEAVRTLVEDGPARVKELLDWGARFDRVDGKLHFTREAAHRRSRILHALGDSTGRELERVLVARGIDADAIRILPFHAGIQLIVEEERCIGAWLLDQESGRPRPVLARAVLLATGGIGRVYQESTNPPIATGDGMTMALNQSVVMENLEFVQFHPTALFLKDTPRFLLSESLRGEGAILRNAAGDRFMTKYHPDGELAPRDVVSRAIVMEMKETRSGIALDLTHLEADFVRKRFPTIHATLTKFGLDMTREILPVHPAAHYSMGGVSTDIHGRTSLSGLYAAGEVSCTGVHGANRLASNSLLEGLVFGARAALAILEEAHPPPKPNPLPPPFPEGEPNLEILNDLRRQVASIMWEGVGILRSATSLIQAREELAQMRAQIGPPILHRRLLETLSMATLGDAIAISAEYRSESRGAQFREDFPERNDTRWDRPTRVVLEEGNYRFIEDSQ